MKHFLFLFLIPFVGIAQIQLKGSITGNNAPLQNASVYLNNTTLGTVTNLEGKFNFSVPKGTFELVVSYVGFITKSISINTENIVEPLQISLSPANNMLDEVVLRNTKYDDEWRRNLSSFKNAFIGRTPFADQCKILNPKVLSFNFDRSNNMLTADAYAPIEIINQALGYKIEFDLVDFKSNNIAITYIGRSKYILMKGGKAKQRRWKKNRAKAFYGSKQDFIRALRNHQLKEEGFIVHQFRRVPNRDRPTDEELKKARHYLRKHNSTINFSRQIKTPKTKLDSMIVLSRKASLPKFKDYLYRKNVPYKDLMLSNDKDSILTFKDHLTILYTKEKESLHYVNSNWNRKNKTRGHQSSTLVMLKPSAIMDPSGDVIDPLDVMVEGYWSYEGFAESLPRDYLPPKKTQ